MNNEWMNNEWIMNEWKERPETIGDGAVPRRIRFRAADGAVQLPIKRIENQFDIEIQLIDERKLEIKWFQINRNEYWIE